MATAAARPLYVLVVDDHSTSAVALSRLLRHEGYEVFQAAGVAEAYAIAAARRVDLLVSDLDLTDGDGCELLRRIRRVHPRVRGIAVTGHDGLEYERMCREAGYEKFFVKPLMFAQLLDALNGPRPTAGAADDAQVAGLAPPSVGQ